MKIFVVRKIKSTQNFIHIRYCQKVWCHKELNITLVEKETDMYRAIDENNVGTKRKRMKSATYEKLDKEIYKWVISIRHSNIPISAGIIKLKALEFAKGLKCAKFQASDGWLHRWEKRFNVRLKTVS